MDRVKPYRLNDKITNFFMHQFLPVPFVTDQCICKVIQSQETDLIWPMLPRRPDDDRLSLATGSSAEGLGIPDYLQKEGTTQRLVQRDRDELILNHNIYKLKDSTTSDELTGPLFVIEPTQDPEDPNYGRLKVTQEYITARKQIGTPLRKEYLLNTTVTSHGLDSWVPLMPIKGVSAMFESIEVHGPAVSGVSSGGLYHDRDQCHGVHFNNWPEVALEFTQRFRPSGWPSKELVQTAIKEGFHMTPVGRKNSKNKDYEWRYSFSKVEKMLAHRISDIQRMVYVHVKLLHTFYFKEPQVIKTYFLKMIFFHLCERIPRIYWRKDDTVGLVQLFLDEIIQCLAEGYLQDYFIDGANLLVNIPLSFRRTVAQKVKYVQKNLFQCYLFIDEHILFMNIGTLTKASKLMTDLIESITLEKHVEMCLSKFVTLIEVALANFVKDRSTKLLEQYSYFNSDDINNPIKLMLMNTNINLYTDLLLNALKEKYQHQTKDADSEELEQTFQTFIVQNLQDLQVPLPIITRICLHHYAKTYGQIDAEAWTFYDQQLPPDFDCTHQVRNRLKQMIESGEAMSWEHHNNKLFRNMVVLEVKHKLSQITESK